MYFYKSGAFSMRSLKPITYVNKSFLIFYKRNLASVLLFVLPGPVDFTVRGKNYTDSIFYL